MSDQQNLTPTVDLLKAQIVQLEATPGAAFEDVLGLYKQLVVALETRVRTPRSRRTPEERKAARLERREAKRNGTWVPKRQGKPWTEEQRAKQQASWTPEKRAAVSAKAKGREVSPEAKANIAKAAEARRIKQDAMKARLAELEAMLANGAMQAEEPKQGRRK